MLTRGTVFVAQLARLEIHNYQRGSESFDTFVEALADELLTVPASRVSGGTDDWMELWLSEGGSA